MKKQNNNVKKTRAYKTTVQDISQEEIKKSFSPMAKKRALELCKKVIKDKQAREQAIAFIKEVDGKKIRNTSGV